MAYSLKSKNGLTVAMLQNLNASKLINTVPGYFFSNDNRMCYKITEDWALESRGFVFFIRAGYVLVPSNKTWKEKLTSMFR